MTVTKSLKKKYEEDVKKVMKEKFGYDNVHKIPKLHKIVLNMGVGEACHNSKLAETIVKQLTKISGQKAVVTKAKQSISSFKLREKTESTKRVGTYIPISNRLLKSRIFVKNWLMTYLPDSVKQAENFQILFGDNTGKNLDVITKVAPGF